MRQRPLVYYADFVIYPLTIGGMAAIGLSFTRPHVWASGFVAGFITWTLLEYLIHRFVFHRLPYVRDLHLAHHEEPQSLIGTPFWLSLGGYVIVVFAPLWWAIGFPLASALVAGLLTGYLWYSFVHHVLHHWPIERSSWFYQAKLRHCLHHYRDNEGNFGVTTGVWDRVFGTAMAMAPFRARQREAA
jgi:sterol desaturase/sphingolipid hydroxylase (fatty acid hydroxylase superfamily)